MVTVAMSLRRYKPAVSTPPTARSPMSTEIQRFFDDYAEAFNALDGAAVAALYAVPSGIAEDSGYTHWPSAEAVRANMLALCELYRARGYIEATCDPAAFLPQGENFAVVDMAWTIRWNGGQAPSRFNTSYNLMRTPAGWRVLLCTAYSESRLTVVGEPGAALPD